MYRRARVDKKEEVSDSRGRKEYFQNYDKVGTEVKGSEAMVREVE